MKNNTGSALIFVSILVAFVGILIMLFVRNTTFYYAFTVDRMHHARAQYALEALAQYGIACCLTPKKDFKTEFSAWPSPDGPYQGTASIEAKNNVYTVVSELFKDGATLGKIRCKVQNLGEKKAVIQEWTQL